MCDDSGTALSGMGIYPAGLKKSENFLFLIAMIFGLLCFGAGACFAYKIMLPFMLYFFNTLSIGSGVSAYISVQNYLSFLLMVLIIFGIVFELPMVSVVLNRLGLLKVSWMKAGRRVVIVVIFVIAALITPPDIVSADHSGGARDPVVRTEYFPLLGL